MRRWRSAERHHAAQQHAHQRRLPRHAGLGENRAQVGARRVLAGAEGLGGFVERHAVGKHQRQRSFGGSEVEQLAHHLVRGARLALGIADKDRAGGPMAVFFRPLAERNGADQHPELAAPRRARDRHGLRQRRLAAVVSQLRAPQQVLELAAFVGVGDLEAIPVEADAVVLRKDLLGLGIPLENRASGVEDHHAHQHAVDRARVERALRFHHIEAGMQPDRALQVRQDGGASGLVRFGEVLRVVLAANAQAALDTILGTDVRAQQVADAERLQELAEDLAAAPVAGAQRLVDRHRPLGGQVDEGIDRVVVAVVRSLGLQRGAVRRSMHRQAAAVAGRRTQDEAHIAGTELRAQHLEGVAPWHGLHRPFIDRGQQRAEFRDAEACWHRQGRRHVPRLNGRHQHSLSPGCTPPCMPAGALRHLGQRNYRDAVRRCTALGVFPDLQSDDVGTAPGLSNACIPAVQPKENKRDGFHRQVHADHRRRRRDRARHRAGLSGTGCTRGGHGDRCATRRPCPRAADKARCRGAGVAG
ncbi:protein of unknown function (plasmid) [Cupriavidus neocaledonicus]|uniref:Uncharacterized protein n=1 Tax=Cupriavidus neocaledonicus TaxID=1040979 RepID=A0A375HUL7_9BURK|nr:hypothetical protein CBM2605_B70078 [Cupriavidus neocaledonicus]SPD60574.1 protein of unknown function [Cupriavidus neocaledonicus]